MSLKGILGKEVLPAGDIMHPKASVLGILGLAVAVGVLIAGYKLGGYGFTKGRSVLGGLFPAAKDGAADLMGDLELV